MQTNMSQKRQNYFYKLKKILVLYKIEIAQFKVYSKNNWKSNG